VFHGYHFGEGILKNKILLVSALALAMGMNAAQAVEKAQTRKRLRLSSMLTVFPLALLTITTILPVTMATC
jgi:L-cystine transport system substrate-binding protein